MRRIREVLHYRQDHGMSFDKIAGALGLSKGSVYQTVRRFQESGLSWPLPEDFPDSRLEAQLYPAPEVSRPLPDAAYLEQELRRPHVTLQLLYEEYRVQHPNGLGRTAFYDYFAQRRRQTPEMKVLHKGGDKLFVDFSGAGLEYIDRTTGACVPVAVFVSAWGASSAVYVEALASQRAEDFVPCHTRVFEYFEAVPHALVPDNLKSGVKQACRYDPVANPLYGALARHYGTTVLPARVRKPKDKAVVESNVLHVQRDILARVRDRTFFSLAEINAALRPLLEAFNNRPMKEYGGQNRWERFRALDQPYAKPLPAQRFRITGVRTDVRVAPNYHVQFQDHYYSVPWELARQRVDVFRVGGLIEIYHDHRHVARHPVGARPYQYTTQAAHMPPAHQYVKGWSRDWFIREAGKISAAVAEAVTVIMDQKDHVQQGFNAALGVLRFAKVYSGARLDAACRRALYFQSVSYRTIKAILAQQLDQQPWEGPQPSPTPVVRHNNLRGAAYYQGKEERHA